MRIKCSQLLLVALPLITLRHANLIAEALLTPSSAIESIIISLPTKRGAVLPSLGAVGTSSSRRSWISNVLVGTATVFSTQWTILPEQACASEELPSFLRDYTKLVPLGSTTRSTGTQIDTKTTGLSLQEIASRLSNDLTQGATGQGGYFLTGDLSTEIFRDDCIFQDPTNRVSSLSQYQTALRILFDPHSSVVELIEPLQLNESSSPRTITGRIRSRGYLRFLPWKPYVTAYESTIVYSVDEDGLIVRQDQTWSKDALKALQESFTPSWVDQAPKSHRATPDSEPKAVTRLFQMINGRRPYEYSNEERQEIDALIHEIVVHSQADDDDKAGSAAATTFDRSLFPGTWILAYLQPGPNGAGIDRRIPFPELDFNDSFQIFGKDNSVVNLGRF